MKRVTNHRRLSCILGVGVSAGAVLLLARGFAADNEPPKKPAAIAQPVSPIFIPIGKANIAGRMFADVNKGVIESPTKRILAGQTIPGSASPSPEFVNPKVEPGKVHWHKSFADACAAAKKSGKPVLLFQMMGKLDDRFC